MVDQEISNYKKRVIKQLAKLSPFLQKYAIGDFSKNIPLTKEENEFTELLVGLNLMVDDIRELIKEKEEFITELKKTMIELEQSNRDLEKALNQIKTLSGLLPICSVCKKIRDDDGYWNLLELYIKEHSNVEFTHGLCPECKSKIYSKEK